MKFLMMATIAVVNARCNTMKMTPMSLIPFEAMTSLTDSGSPMNVLTYLYTMKKGEITPMTKTHKKLNTMLNSWILEIVLTGFDVSAIFSYVTPSFSQ